ncbi:uncharacterized protein BJ212DRAFT_1301326 [Suillus subaureus]|uniref:Uncharacterized protein n=1 Tax=Suillus subaureus TaxID=48587 RepID=A0A9P7JBJ7_9AGAM|nr:uncharacterized protein BJ212DRAFT_1301326 [Suillus subaureus]KAG1812848.1 hypothetical protein BJ212DRAFT_1301326 [Suillus subaureus]
MSDIAAPEFLNELQSLYPAPAKYVDSSWYLAAAEHSARATTPKPSHIARAEDEGGFISLYEATPEELRDTELLRDPTRSKEEVAAAGQAYFDLQYGDTAAEIQPVLRPIYPDLVNLNSSSLVLFAMAQQLRRSGAYEKSP